MMHPVGRSGIRVCVTHRYARLPSPVRPAVGHAGVVTADKVTESVNDNGELLDVYDFHFSAFC